MSDDSAEKTEQPTEKKIRESREKGQVPRSKELASAAVVGMAGITMLVFSGVIVEGAAVWMRGMLSFDRAIIERPELMLPTIGVSWANAMLVVVPIIVACIIAALVATLTVGGWNFSTKAMAPDFKKIDPIKGMGKVFSKNGLMELFKAMVKFGVVTAIAVVVLRGNAGELLGLSREPGTQGLAHGLHLILYSFLYYTIGLLLIAAFDVPFQLWQNNEKMKMSRKEIRDEMKESEGSPELKGKIRQMQQQAAERKMMQDVPTADVVVTNPTHFAVALKYTEGQDRAPTVVAKGGDHVATAIRELARKSDVTLVEAPLLARALYWNVEIGQEIPVTLYKAVAQVLTYVFQLRLVRMGGASAPTLPDLDVPTGMDKPRIDRAATQAETAGD